MSAVEVKELAESFQVLAALIGGLGAIVGAVVGAPLLEWFKDWLGARRGWKSRKAEIIAALRLTLARCDAFFEICDEAANLAPRQPELAAEYRKSLFAFDLNGLSESVDVLISLDPRTSERSAASQYLVQQVVVLTGLMKQVVTDSTSRPGVKSTLPSEATASIVSAAKERLQDLKLYISTFYSDALKVSGSGLLYDSQLAKHLFLVNRLKFEQAYEKRSQIARDYLATLEKAPNNERE